MEHPVARRPAQLKAFAPELGKAFTRRAWREQKTYNHVRSQTRAGSGRARSDTIGTARRRLSIVLEP
jgi:hypothetical protein